VYPHPKVSGFHCWLDAARRGVCCVAEGRRVHTIALRTGTSTLYTDGRVTLEVDENGAVVEARLRPGSPIGHTLSTTLPAFARHLILTLGDEHPLFDSSVGAP
jgi:hypothetical protein